MEALKREFEDIVYNYLKENKRQAFTIVALKKKLEEIIVDPQKKEYGKNNLQNVLKQMKNNRKIRSTQHEGKTHYFISEVFKSTQNDGETHYLVPEIFISAETVTKKVRKKYCKNCKKEVISQFRFRKGADPLFFVQHLPQKSIEARANTGCFCPYCGQRLPRLSKKTIIIAWLSVLVLWGISIMYGFLLFQEEGSIVSFTLAIISTGFVIGV